MELERGRFRSLASLILVVNVVGELQQKRTLAASLGFLAAARLSCSFDTVVFHVFQYHLQLCATYSCRQFDSCVIVLKDILMTFVWRESFSLGSLLLYFYIFSEFLYL